MPVYEYECGACGHRFEEWQKITDKPVKVCPKCQAEKVERLISQTAFHLKGGGWYSDLYSSSKSSDKGGGSGGGEGSKAASTSETKAAAKPEAKKESPGKTGGEGGGSKAAAAS